LSQSAPAHRASLRAREAVSTPQHHDTHAGQKFQERRAKLTGSRPELEGTSTWHGVPLRWHTFGEHGKDFWEVNRTTLGQLFASVESKVPCTRSSHWHVPMAFPLASEGLCTVTRNRRERGRSYKESSLGLGPDWATQVFRYRPLRTQSHVTPMRLVTRVLNSTNS
jgi:hypothetical protein